LIGWDWAKNYVEYRVTQATGRDFAIAGDLDIDLSSHPLIRAEIIRLDNAPWVRFQNLAEIETFALRVDLVALIQRRIVIPQISISKPLRRASHRLQARAWLLLAAAILLEVAGTTSMKLVMEFTRVTPSVLIFVFYAPSCWALTLALKKLAPSIACAIWVGVSTGLITLIGFMYLNDQRVRL
jgi:small multidrug resistance pump